MNSRATRYHGKPCRHGHDGERYRSTRACVACVAALKRAERKRRRAANDDEIESLLNEERK